MNYGDGLYGGIFVAALYSEAYFSNDIPAVIEAALESIPKESDYFKIVSDVIDLHKRYPSDWQSAWSEIEKKWGDVDICGAGSSFNIDAKLNGAYIVMGLLYGDGDILKTMEISTRCGQDSDCNPSNAMAVLGVINGFSGLPADMQEAVKNIGDSLFIHTTYSFNTAVESTYAYSLALIEEDGGRLNETKIMIRKQAPVEPQLEVSFPDLVFDRHIPVNDMKAWKVDGSWIAKMRKSGDDIVFDSYVSDKKGSELELTFEGTGVSLRGSWARDCGKADIYVDGTLHRTIDTYYYFANQQHRESIWHVVNLQPGEHKIRIVVTGEKRPESEGAKVYINNATIFKTGKKRNELQN
jgi:hypothetical protein